jgi:uncharacterized membrane protein
MSEPNQSGLTDNAAGAIAYITFIPAIVFLILPPYNTSTFVKFHAWQSILFNLVAFAINLLVSIGIGIVLTATGAFLSFGFFGLSHLIWLLIDAVWFILWLLCVFKAFGGQRFKLPLIGNFAEQLANKQTV